MGLSKEIIGGILIAAGLVQLILNPIATFGSYWTSCYFAAGTGKILWGLEEAKLELAISVTLHYDNKFLEAMNSAFPTVGTFVGWATAIEVMNIVALCQGLVALSAGVCGLFVTKDPEKTSLLFKVSWAFLAMLMAVRLFGVGAWLTWVVPTLSNLSLAEPINALYGDTGIPSFMLKCGSHEWEFGVWGTAIELILVINALVVVKITDFGSSGTSQRSVSVKPNVPAMQMSQFGGPQSGGMVPPGAPVPGSGGQYQPPPYGQFGQPNFTGMPPPPAPGQPGPPMSNPMQPNW